MGRRTRTPAVQVVAVPHPDAETAYGALIEQLGESLAQHVLGEPRPPEVATMTTGLDAVSRRRP